MRKSLNESGAPVIGVAPIIAGRALKEPTAKMMREFGMQLRATAAARHYGNSRRLYLGFRRCSSDNLAQDAVAAKTLMLTLAVRDVLATTALGVADDLAAAGTLRLQEEGDGKLNSDPRLITT
jgi:LPPG:FO 2-phospho-L-lactate transferase